MNERIKLLAEQAGFCGESMLPIIGTCQETALNNFAELIVNECAKTANINFDNGFCPVGGFIKAVLSNNTSE